MNFNDTKVSISPADVPSTIESAQKILPQRVNRKNHHTKKRDTEKFRLQKKFSTVAARLSSRRTLDETLETMFDMPRQMIVKCLVFHLQYLRNTLLISAPHTYTCSDPHVVIENEDLACLVVATVVQIEAKVWFGPIRQPHV